MQSILELLSQEVHKLKRHKIPPWKPTFFGWFQKIIHTYTRIAFGLAASVAKVSFPSHTVTKQALPSSLANTGMLLQRTKTREVLLHKGEAEDTFQSHYSLA